ncbi:MAG: DUF4349 domain-containing protein [Actinobacteria bacterium]|nr:DUF4349 domain-containing protein [Actinomycetota bacterium]
MLGILSLGLAACGGDDEESTSMATTFDQPARQAADAGGSGEGAPAIAPAATEAAAEAAPEATEAPAATDAPAADSGGAGGSFGGSTVDPAPAPTRLLQIEVTIAVEVPDVSAALPVVVDIAADHGGQVYGSDVELGDPETATGEVVVKLPPAELEAAITDMTALGVLRGRFQNTDDVTDTVTDVETRIINQQQSVDRVQAMLAEAKDLGEVVLLEGELTARQLVLEQLLAQQRNLRNSTALSTLTVQLTATPIEAVPTTTVPKLDLDIRTEDSVGDAFATGGRAFVTAGTAVLIFLGYTGPFIALALVALLVVRSITRRQVRRNRSAAPPLPPAPDEGRRTNEPDSAGAARS